LRFKIISTILMTAPLLFYIKRNSPTNNNNNNRKEKEIMDYK